MKQVISTILLVLLCYVLQTTILQQLQVAQVMPNLLLIITIANGYMYGRTGGMFTGFFCGLVIDMALYDVIGVCSLIYMVIGFLAGYANRIYYGDDFTIPMILIGVGDLLYNFFYYICMYLLRGRMQLPYYFIRIMIPEMVYTVVAGILLYKLMNWISLKLQPPPVENPDKELENGNPL